VRGRMQVRYRGVKLESNLIRMFVQQRIIQLRLEKEIIVKLIGAPMRFSRISSIFTASR
jgi:hypothetical protein